MIIVACVPYVAFHCASNFKVSFKTSKNCANSREETLHALLYPMCIHQFCHAGVGREDLLTVTAQSTTKPHSSLPLLTHHIIIFIMVVLSQQPSAITAAASPDSCTTAAIMEDVDTKQQQPQQQILTPTADAGNNNSNARSPSLSATTPKCKTQPTTIGEAICTPNDSNSADGDVAKDNATPSNKDANTNSTDEQTPTGKKADKQKCSAPDDNDKDVLDDEVPSSRKMGSVDDDSIDEKPAAAAAGDATAASTTTTTTATTVASLPLVLLQSSPSTLLSTRPVKRGKTAYFIFCDEKRPEVQKQVRSCCASCV
jgi:hypothetical protein